MLSTRKPCVFQRFLVLADYWKSQDRKYCDFCKCWIADNKPSVEFHEKGRRHKENVAKKLRTITKQSARTQRENDKFESTLKRMESAALEAYQKDVELNRDITSVAINQKLKEDNLAINVSKPPSSVGVPTVDFPREQYYIEIAKHNKVSELLRAQEEKKLDEEERARIAREKLKERRVVDEDFLKPSTSGPIIPEGKTEPYGQWQTIRSVKHVDLQLPQQPEYFEVPVAAEPEPVVKEFKEKVVVQIEGTETGFKKRKFGGASKRNTRQRLDDD